MTAQAPDTQEPPRTTAPFSAVRILVAAVLLAGTVFAGGVAALQLTKAGSDTSSQWFAPYIDVTLPPVVDFQDPASNPTPDVVLAFVVSSKFDWCVPSWGTVYSLDEAGWQLDLDRRIVRLRQRGGDVMVSFGGAANDELARSCTDPEKLLGAYRAVVERYDVTAIDLDLEGQTLRDGAASARRATAVAQLQAERRKAGRPLDVWVTLPVAPTGLEPEAVSAVDALLKGKVDLAGVNVMTMDYGASRRTSVTFVKASEQALDATAKQVAAAYRRNGQVLDEAGVWAKVGMTPMIGQNDTAADRLDVEGAKQLVKSARTRGVRRVSMWSLNRDVQCGGNIDAAITNDSCSGVKQDRLQFSRIFATSTSRAAASASAATTASSGRTTATTPAAPSGVLPYAEWRKRREYEAGAKATWRGVVYEAKWWTSGDQPDAPVDNPWDSPWRVIGPVLPNEAVPPTSTTLPSGTCPAWDEGTVYYPGDRVQYGGACFKAKWWTRGDNPTADVDNAWENPWTPVGAPVTTSTTTTTVNPRTTTTTKS